MRIKAEELKHLTQAIFDACGADPTQSQIVTEVLIWCDLIGRQTQGIWRMPTYVKRLSCGLLRCPCQPRYTKKAPALTLIDGDQGFGQYLGRLAMEHAIELAREHGVGFVAVSNSNFYGAGAYYVQLAASQGMIGFTTSNSMPHQAAFGGIKAVLGTNPLAFGAPRRHGRSFLLDMSTAASAGSMTIKAADEGKALQTGIAIDTKGKPTTDPHATLLPFGGAKGFGLAMMVEILSGVITGSGISHGVGSMFKDFTRSGNNGHVFLAINIAQLMSMDHYFDRLESLLTIVKSSAEDAEDNRTVLIPGETRWETYATNLREGIPLDDKTRDSLGAVARQYGLQLPWY